MATIAPDATVRDAVALLNERRVGALVVSADGRTIDGILSERDVVRGLGSTLDRRSGPRPWPTS